jgi:hypothetical protein
MSSQAGSMPVNRFNKLIWKFVVSYLLAAIACLLCVIWPDFEGHVHLPFSSFPRILVLSPISPFAALLMFEYQPMQAFAALTIFVAVFALVFSGFAGAFPRKRKRP